MSVGTYIGNSHVRYREIIAAHALFLFAIYKYTSELTDTGKFAQSWFTFSYFS